MKYRIGGEVGFANMCIGAINGYEIFVPSTHESVYQCSANLVDFPIWIKLTDRYRIVLCTCEKKDVLQCIKKCIESPYFQ